MLRIAIDLNDVIRDYSRNFVKYFKKAINHGFNEEEVDFYTNDMKLLLPFDNDEQYRRFVYEDYPFELYSKCPPVDKNLPRDLNEWIDNDASCEDVEIFIVSPMESDLTIQSSYSFLSKIGSRIREVYFPIDSATIWDRCDVLITANPRFFYNKKDNKKIVKIKKDYNKELKSDLEYDSLFSLIKDNNFFEKIFKK